MWCAVANENIGVNDNANDGGRDKQMESTEYQQQAFIMLDNNFKKAHNKSNNSVHIQTGCHCPIVASLVYQC